MMANARIVLLFFVLEVTAETVFSPLGLTVGLPCKYVFESRKEIKQLSLQWKGPGKELLCHYIKHKAYQNCTAGYSLAYEPDNVTLTITAVRPADLGTHVCSVSKRHDFSDYSVDLVLTQDSSSNSSVSSGYYAGHANSLSNLLALLVTVWQQTCHAL